MKTRISYTLFCLIIFVQLIEQKINAQICFNPAINYPAGVSAYTICTADFNCDGKADVAAASQSENMISILLGTGTGGFGVGSTFVSGTGPLEIISADFNGDGKYDLATANYDAGLMSITLGDGTGSFGSVIDYPVGPGSNWSSVTCADFNTDTYADLAFGWTGYNGFYLALGNGDGTFGTSNSFLTGCAPNSITSADFNEDGKTDIALSNYNFNTVSVVLGNGAGGFGTAYNYGTILNSYSIRSADFNNDGKLDLVTANYDSNNLSIFLGTGTGSFGFATNLSVGTQPISVLSADFNGDGNQDLVSANSATNNASVIAGLGNGSFGTVTNYSFSYYPNQVISADFNGDGKTDLCAGTGNSNLAILLNAHPSIIYTQSESHCGTGILVLTAEASGGVISWFESPTGGLALGSGTVFSTPSISGSSIYYVEAAVSGCDALPRMPVNATINDTFNILQSVILDEGDSILVGMNSYKNTGVFIDTLFTVNGCDSIITTDITVTGSSNIYAFSPNNDGINDLWLIDGIEVQLENQVIIFDRWGEVVRKYDNYNNDDIIWDGKSANGKELVQGTYFFTIAGNGETNESGWVQIVK